MNISAISVRYAKALFNIAKEENKQDIIYKDIDVLADSLEMKELREIIENPVIVESEKLKILKYIFSGCFDELTMRFLEFTVKKKRLKYLSDIFRNFADMYLKSKGIKKVYLTTAYPLTDELRTKIKNKLSELYNTTIDFNEKTDKKLIGGFIIQVDDKQIDAGIASKIERLRRAVL